MAMKVKTIFIISLFRSGSSVLGLMMQNFQDHVFLGEIYGLWKNPDKATSCRCGQNLSSCPFWGPVELSGNLENAYKTVVERFSEFNNDAVMVDSSKRLRALQAVQRVSEVKVIFLIRDVRAWVTSHRLHGSGKSSMRLFIDWYRRNRQIQKHLKGTNCLTLGYEELALYPKLSLDKIADWLGIVRPSTYGIVNEGHRVGGNRMQGDKKKNTDVVYDNRWFYHDCWRLPSLVLPMVMKLNRRVYSNIDGPFGRAHYHE